MAISTSNQRLAKNTYFLYIRMIVLMLVTLYTSRVVIDILGVEDFGIYNIIGGIIVLLSFMKSAMTSATQRFFSFEIGKGDKNQLNKIFSVSVICHVAISAIFIFLAETIGLWFVYTQLNIPADRIAAAHWVYHFSVITFVINIILTPYHSIIIAYEKMSFYAYVSIIEAFLRLAVTFLLPLIFLDRLIMYALLLALVALLCNSAYVVYSMKRFLCCRRLAIIRNKNLYQQLMSYYGWTFLGGAANISAQQGGNILINVYNGVGANAGFGIAGQVSHAVSLFVNNFQMAFNPQLVKLYAQSNIKELNHLIMRTSLFSFYLIWVISLPLMVNLPTVLNLWLNTVPPYAENFCLLMIIYYLIDAIQAPLFMSIYATGKIRNYQIWLSIFIFLNIPVSWIFISMGFSPVSVLVVRVAINIITAIVRTAYMNYLFEFDTKSYIGQVVSRAILISTITSGIALLLKNLLGDGIIDFFILTSLLVLITAAVIWFIGMNMKERNSLRMLVLSFVKR